MEELQHFAGKIEEIKHKITDEEYKDLLELSHKYYDKEVIKKEKIKKKKFIKVLCVSSQIIVDIDIKNNYGASTFGEYREEIQWEYGEDSDGDDEYEGPIKNIKVKAKVIQKKQSILFEVKPRSDVEGYYIDMKNCVMTDDAYDKLMEDKYQHNSGQSGGWGSIICPTTYIYLSHFEL